MNLNRHYQPLAEWHQKKLTLFTVSHYLSVRYFARDYFSLVLCVYHPSVVLGIWVEKLKNRLDFLLLLFHAFLLLLLLVTIADIRGVVIVIQQSHATYTSHIIII